MRSVLAASIIALLSGPTHAGETVLDADFACSGKLVANGYPLGGSESREHFVLEIRTGHPATIVDTTRTVICSPGATCAYSDAGNRLDARIDHVPNADPIYNARFTIDTATGRYDFSGGGLDGGWSRTGKCKVTNRPARP